MNSWDKLNAEMDARIQASKAAAAEKKANAGAGGQKRNIPAGGGFYKPPVPQSMAGKPPMNRGKPPTPQGFGGNVKSSIQNNI